MSGRVYDYNLGRFLSVDPFIQAPSNSQSMNPYSYIMNNPLAGTDPTGYISTMGSLERMGGGNENFDPFSFRKNLLAGFSTNDDNGHDKITKKGLGREIAALRGQDNLEAYDWVQSQKARVTTKVVSGAVEKVSVPASRISSQTSETDESSESVPESTYGDSEYPDFNIPGKYKDEVSLEVIRQAYDFIYVYNFRISGF